MKTVGRYMMKKTICMLLLFLAVSCNEKGDMWRESVDVGDGARVSLYHTEYCHKERPFFCSEENMIHYQKMKHHVFHFCFSEERLELLTTISRYNIKEYQENALEFCEDNDDIEYYYHRTLLLDTSKCEHGTKFAMKDGKIIKLKNKWLP